MFACVCVFCVCVYFDFDIMPHSYIYRVLATCLKGIHRCAKWMCVGIFLALKIN